ncbi:3-oxoacyl-ACP reductase FabG [Mycolicibacterium confluentis]|uniref:3-oxoacyl-ACP reductase FabG n=1 Tax=Mycolicibacterium confluentis TaxID=28047 RepID=UPI000A147D85|nr:3-oxoacyl-ACP reductase FabG [Mycolicibacterium confluentis]MCV7318837.1 3-oxoacyl-ACP reductase FabG [Mycolicibacterium confluentis]ORV23052.1 3-ketoacyl-ACP reductase [Mycolicibacterium confluentis]
MTDWSTMRVLVTGGSQGIGLGIAETFLEAGAAVAIAGRNRATLAAAAETLSAPGRQVETIVADVADRAACDRMAQECQQRLGGLDVLCANAGIYPEALIDDLTADDVTSILAVNVGGTIFSAQACRPALRESGRGRVVVTSSITGPVTGYPGLSHYAASKAAQLGFVRSAALEFARDGITINAVLPGSIRTEGLDGLGADAIASMIACIPQRRLGSPADIAAAAMYFASEEAGFVTGQTLIVDGGQTLPEFPESQ